MIAKLIRWIGIQFMSGSGYEERLHKSLEELNQKVTKTNHNLEKLYEEIHFWRVYQKNLHR